MSLIVIKFFFDNNSRKRKINFLISGGTQIELVEPLPGNTSIASFLEKNPNGGQHHLCYEVPDIHAAKAEFEAMGKRVLGKPRTGAHGTLIFFVHPKDMGGVLTEIMETPKSGH